MSFESTADRSRCNQPSLRSYIGCFATAGWTPGVCQFRTWGESVVRAEIMPHSKDRERKRERSRLHDLIKVAFERQGWAFQKGFTEFRLVFDLPCGIRSRAPPCVSSAPCFVTPSHFKALSAHWKQSPGQKYKPNQRNWMHTVGGNSRATWRASSLFSHHSCAEQSCCTHKWSLSRSTCCVGTAKELKEKAPFFKYKWLDSGPPRATAKH